MSHNKNFPRIYSLSTVGIRNHYNSDYRFHPFRTDFVGDSGVGKSIIADVLQRKHSDKCTFYTLRFDCSFAAANTIKPQLL